MAGSTRALALIELLYVQHTAENIAAYATMNNIAAVGSMSNRFQAMQHIAPCGLLQHMHDIAAYVEAVASGEACKDTFHSEVAQGPNGNYMRIR